MQKSISKIIFCAQNQLFCSFCRCLDTIMTFYSQLSTNELLPIIYKPIVEPTMRSKVAVVPASAAAAAAAATASSSGGERVYSLRELIRENYRKRNSNSQQQRRKSEIYEKLLQPQYPKYAQIVVKKMFNVLSL